MLKSKIALSIFTPLNLNSNADFQEFYAEIPSISSFLELCLQLYRPRYAGLVTEVWLRGAPLEAIFYGDKR